MKSRGRFVAIFTLLLAGIALSSAALLAAPRNANSSREIEADRITGAIVFADDRSGNYQIYSVDGDGSNLHRLTNSPGDNFAPHWSPDGTMIAFLHATALPSMDESIPPAAWPFYSIEIMSADGTNAHELLHEAGRRFNDLSWSPDSQQLAFSCESRGSTDAGNQLCVVGIDGKDERQITPSNLSAELNSVAWSPNSNWIAFIGQPEPADRPSGIYLISLDSGQVRTVAELADSPYGLSWSPDGSQIAYISRQHNRLLTIVDIDGSNEQEFDLRGLAGDLTMWSPDGTRLLFLATTATQSADGLYTIAQDGTAIEEIVPDGSNVVFADWSPDGKRIVYAREVQEPPASTTPWPGIESEIGVARLDSTTKQGIVESGSSQHGYGLLVSSPDWRPVEASDARAIATEPPSPTATASLFPSWAYTPGIAAITPDGLTSLDTPAFTADEAMSYAMRHSPFEFDQSQPPPSITVEFVTRAQLQSRLDQNIDASYQDLYCVVTFHGHFDDTTFSREEGTGAMPGNVGYMIFDAHTGNELGEGAHL